MVLVSRCGGDIGAASDVGGVSSQWRRLMERSPTEIGDAFLFMAFRDMLDGVFSRP